MPAAVEKMTRIEGSNRSWHGEESVTDIKGFTLAKWAKNAGLDWRAHKEPLFIKADKDSEEGEFIQVKDQIAVVRDSDRRILGFHSPAYEIVQPIDTLEALDEIIQLDDRFKWETAGSLDGGRKIFTLAKYQEEMKVVGEEHKPYLLASTSFDGSMATTFAATLERVVCANTLRMALNRKDTGLVRLRHRTEYTPQVKAQMIKELEQVISGFKQYQGMAERLALVRMSKEQAEEFLKSLLFVPELEDVDLPDGTKVKAYSKPTTRMSNLMDKLIGSYQDTLKEGTDKGTAWAVANAITRYADHEMGSRVTQARLAEGETKESVKLESKLFGAADRFKQQGLIKLFAANDIKPQEFLQAA